MKQAVRDKLIAFLRKPRWFCDDREVVMKSNGQWAPTTLLKPDAIAYRGMKLKDIPGDIWYLSLLGFINGILPRFNRLLIVDGHYVDTYNVVIDGKLRLVRKGSILTTFDGENTSNE